MVYPMANWYPKGLNFLYNKLPVLLPEARGIVHVFFCTEQSVQSSLICEARLNEGAKGTIFIHCVRHLDPVHRVIST